LLVVLSEFFQATESAVNGDRRQLMSAQRSHVWKRRPRNDHFASLVSDRVIL